MWGSILGGSVLIGVSWSLRMGMGDGRLMSGDLGWAKFMQWKYPVEVVVTSKKTFKAAGAIEAAATL